MPTVPSRIAATSAALAGLALLTPTGTTAQPQTRAVAARDSSRAFATYDAFGFALFRRVVARDSGNVLLSPASAGLALAMTATGARGPTLAEMSQALGLDRAPPETVAARNQGLLTSLRDQHDVELTIANALWGQRSVPFAPAFLDRTRRAFDAQISVVDFTAPAAVAAINDWVRSSTKGKIPTILDGRPDPSTVLILTNAVYFKGKWKDRFDSAQTRPRPFRKRDGTVVQRPMMTRVGDYGTFKGEHWRGLRLPYRGDRFSMYVLLPDSGLGSRRPTGRSNQVVGPTWSGRSRRTKCAS